jgi:hypothetical protein
VRLIVNPYGLFREGNRHRHSLKRRRDTVNKSRPRRVVCMAA